LVILELAQIMAEISSKRDRLSKDAKWIHATTHATARDLCGCVIVAAWAADGHLFWQRLQEVILEQRIGRVRAYFPTFQMTVPDYWRASGRLMEKETNRWHGLNPKPAFAELDAMLNDNTFCATAARVFESCIKLATMCSDHAAEDLKFWYMQKAKMSSDEFHGVESDGAGDDDGRLPPPPKAQEKPQELSLEQLANQMRASVAFKQ
jgi:hypothetical protein